VYYVVFYHEIKSIIKSFIRGGVEGVGCIRYDFVQLDEIGSGDYRTVYTARYRNKPGTFVLKRFKNYNEKPELLISEVSNIF